MNLCVDCGKEIKPRSTRCKSCAVHHTWANKSIRDKRLAIFASSEYKKKMSAAIKESWQDEDIRAARVRGLNSLETREKIRKGRLPTKEQRSEDARVRMLALWQDPIWKERMLIVLKDPEVRRKTSESVKRVWADPAYRKRLTRVGANAPYPPEFNEVFKEMVRQRDEYTCQQCREPGECVHHIDYDKKNTVSENCVTLCRSCHSRTNHNRESWQQIFSTMIQGRTYAYRRL